MMISESLNNFEKSLLQKKEVVADTFDVHNPLYESIVKRASSADIRNCRNATDLTNKYEAVIKESLENEFPDKHWTEVTSCNIKDSLLESHNDIEKVARKIVEGLQIEMRTSTEKKPTGVLAKNMKKRSIAEQKKSRGGKRLVESSKNVRRKRPLKEDYEDYENVDVLGKAIDDAYADLLANKNDGGCYTFKLYNGLAVCVGWESGYDPKDTPDGDGYNIVAGIKVYTSDSMRTDYEWLNAPYYENGEVWDTTCSLNGTNGRQVAEYLLKEYHEMEDLYITNDGKILDLPSEVTFKKSDFGPDVNFDVAWDEELVSEIDELLDQYGYLTYDFDYNVEGDNVVVTDIKWEVDESLKKSRNGKKLTEKRDSREVKDNPFDYERHLLGRLKSDCDYTLGACRDHGSSFGAVQKHFWAGNSGNQIAKMRELHQLSKDMDDIVTDSDIDTYEKRFRDWSKQEESLKEAKHDLYVNGDYVCSSDRYKRAKDYKQRVLSDKHVDYPDETWLKTGKLTRKDIGDTDKVVVKRDKTRNESLKEGEEVEYRKKYYSSIKPDGTGESEYWEVEEPAHSKDWHLGGRNKKVLDKGEWQRRQGMKDESLKESDQEKTVIYKSLGKLRSTPKSNYNARIQNARKIQNLDDFNSSDEVIDYYVKNGWAKGKEDFEVIDESSKCKGKACRPFRGKITEAKGSKLSVLLVEPYKAPRQVEIDSGLESLQNAVDGYIEVIYPFDDPVGLICNEEGKINGMDLNRALRDEDGEIYDIVAGPFLVVGLTDEDFCSLSPEYVSKYTQMFKHPEEFFRMGGRIVAYPIDESLKENSNPKPASKNKLKKLDRSLKESKTQWGMKKGASRRSLKENWDHQLKSGIELRDAIQNADGEDDYKRIIDALKACYKELSDKKIIDEFEYEDAIDDISLYVGDGTFSDWESDGEPIEDAIDSVLNDFWDLCDSYRVWVPIKEFDSASFETTGGTLRYPVSEAALRRRGISLKERYEDVYQENTERVKRVEDFLNNIGYIDPECFKLVRENNWGDVEVEFSDCPDDVDYYDIIRSARENLGCSVEAEVDGKYVTLFFFGGVLDDIPAAIADPYKNWDVEPSRDDWDEEDPYIESLKEADERNADLDKGIKDEQETINLYDKMSKKNVFNGVEKDQIKEIRNDEKDHKRLLKKIKDGKLTRVEEAYDDAEYMKNRYPEVGDNPKDPGESNLEWVSRWLEKWYPESEYGKIDLKETPNGGIEIFFVDIPEGLWDDYGADADGSEESEFMDMVREDFGVEPYVVRQTSRGGDEWKSYYIPMEKQIKGQMNFIDPWTGGVKGFDESLKEDTVKQGDSWVNKGKEGTHGKFKTKKGADAQRKAMFANGYKAEGLKESRNKTYYNKDDVLRAVSGSTKSRLTKVINTQKQKYGNDMEISVQIESPYKAYLEYGEGGADYTLSRDGRWEHDYGYIKIDSSLANAIISSVYKDAGVAQEVE